MSSPPRQVHISPDNEKAVSPGVTTVGSADSHPSLTIHHTASSNGSNKKSGAAAKTILGLSKPAAVVTSLLFLGTFGAGAWGWFQLPGLNDQIDELEAQVDRLTGQVDRLSQENDRFQELNNDLNQTVTNLEIVKNDLERNVADLNSTVKDLRDTNEDLKEENRKFAELNQDLQVIVSHLNLTANSLNQTYEQLAQDLAEMVQASRVIAILNIETLYQDQAQFWDCSFRDRFRNKPYVINEDAPIGDEIAIVLDYMEERVLEPLCISRTDFSSFLDERFGLDLLSSNNLFQGTEIYTTALLVYYFPDPGETGVTETDWAIAGYRCENVTEFAFNQSS